MKRNQSSIVVAFLAASVLIAGQQPDVPKPPNQAKKIHGEGCVETGVDARCLIVRDLHAGKLYNILVGEPRPTPGEGIEFTGTLHEGANICMQGAAIEVDHWERKESLKCRHTPAPKK